MSQKNTFLQEVTLNSKKSIESSSSRQDSVNPQTNCSEYMSFVGDLHCNNTLEIFERILDQSMHSRHSQPLKVVEEIELIKKQSDFLRNLQDQIKNSGNATSSTKNMFAQQLNSHDEPPLRRAKDSNGCEVQALESSFSSMSSIYHQNQSNNFFESDQNEFKTKFAEEFERSLVTSALEEVESCCSSETLQTIKKYVLNSKSKEYEAATAQVEKLKRENEDLRASLLIKSNEFVQSQSRNSDLESQVRNFEEERKKVNLRLDRASEKEKNLHRNEMSMVFKEKMYLEGKKRYQREKIVFTQIREKVNELYSKMHSIWEEICQKMSSAELNSTKEPETTAGKSLKCECWKNDVMQKCKNQLVEQRQLLFEEEEQIQREFQLLENMSEQIKKLTNAELPRIV